MFSYITECFVKLSTTDLEIGNLTPASRTARKASLALDVIAALAILGCGICSFSGVNFLSLSPEIAYILVGGGIAYVIANINLIQLRGIQELHLKNNPIYYRPIAFAKQQGQNLESAAETRIKIWSSVDQTFKISRIVNRLILVMSMSVLVVALLGMHEVIALPKETAYYMAAGGAIFGTYYGASLIHNSISRFTRRIPCSEDASLTIISLVAIAALLTIGLHQKIAPVPLSNMLLGGGIFFGAGLLIFLISHFKNKSKGAAFHNSLYAERSPIKKALKQGLEKLGFQVINSGLFYCGLAAARMEDRDYKILSSNLNKDGVYCCVREKEIEYGYSERPRLHFSSDMTLDEVQTVLKKIEKLIR